MIFKTKPPDITKACTRDIPVSKQCNCRNTCHSWLGASSYPGSSPFNVDSKMKTRPSRFCFLRGGASHPHLQCKTVNRYRSKWTADVHTASILYSYKT